MMDDLDHLLARRAAPVVVPDALMARILADALREQPQPFAFAARAAAPAQIATPPMNLWQIIADLFGGGGVVAGLATAACAGLYLGVAQPSAITALSVALAGSSAVDQLDFMPSIDTLLAEE